MCPFRIIGAGFVTLKDSVFQSSSPLRHVAELLPVLEKKDTEVSTLLMFTDGGPDHNCKHLSVQTALLAMFLLGGMDTMVVLRTAPQQSWTNPAERIMSILNLGLQGCSLARTAMDEKFEVTMRKCNGMSAIRRAAVDSMLASKESLVEQPTPQGARSLEVSNIEQEMPLPEPVNGETVSCGEASIIVRQQPLLFPTNGATVDDAEASTIVQEKPIADPGNAMPMGGGEASDIVQEQPFPDTRNATSMDGGEEHQSENEAVPVANEAVPVAKGTCELPETLGGPDVGSDDDSWMLDEDSVDGGCETSQPPTMNTIIEGFLQPRADASNEHGAAEPTSTTSVVSNARPADIPVYDDGNFEEVYATSIATPLRIVEGQFRQLMWNDTPLEVHQPATNQEVWLILYLHAYMFAMRC
jgi:hypothetical protein